MPFLNVCIIWFVILTTPIKLKMLTFPYCVSVPTIWLLIGDELLNRRSLYHGLCLAWTISLTLWIQPWGHPLPASNFVIWCNSSCINSLFCALWNRHSLPLDISTPFIYQSLSCLYISPTQIRLFERLFPYFKVGFLTTNPKKSTDTDNISTIDIQERIKLT